MKVTRGKGLIIIYTGNGKGKTTAAMGLALRAAGHHLKVLMIQCIKGNWHYGELEAVKRIYPYFEIIPMGKSFLNLRKKEGNPEDRRAVAAAVIVVYALIVALIGRKIKLSSLNQVFSEGTRSSTMILMIVVGAITLGTVLTFLQVPQDVCAFIGKLTLPPWVIMSVLCLTYIVLGCFLEVVSILMITVPTVYPLVLQLGYNGLWFGVFLVLLIEIALITPPIGVNLYVIQGIAKTGIEPVIRGVWPYVVMLALGLFLLYMWPDLVLWLPGTMGYGGVK